MDSLKGAFNSFSGGQNQQQPQQNQQQGFGEGGHQQQQQSGSGGMGNLGNLGSMFGGGQNQQQQQQPQGQGGQQQSGGLGGMFGGLTNKFNSAAGGGVESEKNEDYLDKGVDFVQERFMGQGPQNNESAMEQAKDEQISDFIRDKYKSTTGKDFFVKDKETRLG